MSSDDQNRYRQLALFATIIAEVVMTPSILGGLVYWWMREKPTRTFWTGVAAVIGLGIGFYQVYRLSRNESSKSHSSK